MAFIKTHKKTVLTILLAAEACVLLGLFGWYLFQRTKMQDRSTGFSLGEWNSEYALYEDSVWYIDKEMTKDEDTDDEEFVIKSPPLHLAAGYYTVRAEYDCSGDQTFWVSADGSDGFFVKANPFTLDSNKHEVYYRFFLSGSVDNLRLQAIFGGSGFLRLRQVDLTPSAIGWLQLVLLTAAFFLLIDIVYLFRKKLAAHRTTVLELLLVIGVVSLPLLTPGLNSGHDMHFHIKRIEGIAAELKRGIIPVRMSSLWVGGYGYPISVYYGDILLYFPAVIRAAGVPAIACYKIYLFFIHSLTAGISFACFRRIFHSERTAVVLTAAYCLAGYRLVNIYIRGAMGEYSAMAFLPIIALAVHRLYVREKGEADASQQKGFIIANAALLMVGMTGILQTHTLSCEMTAIILLLVCVLNWRRTLQKPVLLAWLLGAGWTVILNIWFLVPFIDYMTHVTVRINLLMDLIQTSQGLGASFLQYFAVFRDPYGVATPDMPKSLALSPGLVLMAGLIAAMFLLTKKKCKKVFLWHFGLSLFLLLVASNLFPWDMIGRCGRVGRALTQVQFPWRYLELAVLTLTLLLGDVLQEMEQMLSGDMQKVLHTASMSAALLSAAVFLGQYAEKADVIRFFDTAELYLYGVSGAEYLLPEVHPRETAALNPEPEAIGMEKLIIESRDGTRWSIRCQAGEDGGQVVLPVFAYRYYRISDEQGTIFPIKNDGTGRITFFLPPDYEGLVHLAYVPPVSWRAAEAVSLLTLLASVCWAVKRYRQRNQRKPDSPRRTEK